MENIDYLHKPGKRLIYKTNNKQTVFWSFFYIELLCYDMEEKNISRIFSENIIYYRKKLGHSQYDLAMISGISRTMISHYEREGMIPTADRLQALANALNIPVFKLFKTRLEETNTETDLTNIDSRSVKKLLDILSLPPDDRNDLYRILNKMLRKNQLEKEQKL